MRDSALLLLIVSVATTFALPRATPFAYTAFEVSVFMSPTLLASLVVQNGRIPIPDGYGPAMTGCVLPISTTADDGMTRSFSMVSVDAVSLVPVTTRQDPVAFPQVAVMTVLHVSFGESQSVLPSNVTTPSTVTVQSTVASDMTLPSDPTTVAESIFGSDAS